MSVVRILAIACSVACCSGCIDIKWVASLHPLYSEDVGIFEPKLVGTWIAYDPVFETSDSEKTYTVTHVEENTYRVLFRYGQEISATYDARLVELGAFQYLDLCPRDVTHFDVVPVHRIARVEIEEDTVRFGFCNPGTLSEMLEKEGVTISHVDIPDDPARNALVSYLLLTASTNELQRFFGEYGAELFPLLKEARRQKQKKPH